MNSQLLCQRYSFPEGEQIAVCKIEHTGLNEQTLPGQLLCFVPQLMCAYSQLRIYGITTISMADKPGLSMMTTLAVRGIKSIDQQCMQSLTG
ncbi:hypothetical protein D3C77_430090 [compost metagenome]